MHDSARGGGMVPFSTSDSAHLEESYRRDPRSRVALGGGRFVVHLDRMVSVTRGKDGERAVRRSEPYARLVELLEDSRVGVTSLCYHRLNDRVCVTTGRPFDTSDDARWEAHTAEVEAARAEGRLMPTWSPAKGALEPGNQAMLVAAEWHLTVLRWLQTKRVDASAAKAMAADPSRRDVLRLVSSCYRLLYHATWGHRANRRVLSHTRTLRFLFRYATSRSARSLACPIGSRHHSHQATRRSRRCESRRRAAQPLGGKASGRNHRR